MNVTAQLLLTMHREPVKDNSVSNGNAAGAAQVPEESFSAVQASKAETPQEETLRDDCMKSLTCLYLATEKSIADDVNNKVKAYINQLKSPALRATPEPGEQAKSKDSGEKKASEHSTSVRQIDRFVFLDDRPWPYMVSNQSGSYWLYYWAESYKNFATLRKLSKGEEERFRPLAMSESEAAVYLTERDVLAAYDFVEKMVPRADAFNGDAPLWHGWALREAFVAGAAWQTKRRQTSER